jgi:hypothetical protein
MNPAEDALSIEENALLDNPRRNEESNAEEMGSDSVDDVPSLGTILQEDAPICDILREDALICDIPKGGDWCDIPMVKTCGDQEAAVH